MRLPLLAAIFAAFVSTTAPPSIAQAKDVVHSVSIDSSYSRRSVSRATRNGALVELYGARRGYALEAVENLSLPGWYADRPFIAIAFDPQDRKIDRIVLAFGDRAASFSGICKGQPWGRRWPRPTGAPTVVTAAFCDGFQAESHAVLESDSLDDPRSKAFHRAMTRLLKKILPRRNRNSAFGDDDCIKILRGC